MAHPRMYSDDDPYLSDLRKVALAFPESHEVEAWGRPTFRAGKKIFATFAGTDERPSGVIFKPDSDDRLALRDDERYYSPPYWGASGWLALDFEAAPVDWDEVRELLDASYRQVALKRMVRVLEAEGSGG
jgi:predicted DNA-binding protein (MmcQ/YjbR family)